MLNKISETQRSMLLAAAGRDDRIVTPSTNARAPARKSLADKLVEAGWARLIKARNGAPVWRKEAETGQTYALQLTAKGMRAIAAANKENIEDLPVVTVAEAAASNASTPASTHVCDPQTAYASKSANEMTAAATTRAPRANFEDRPRPRHARGRCGRHDRRPNDGSNFRLMHGFPIWRQSSTQRVWLGFHFLEFPKAGQSQSLMPRATQNGLLTLYCTGRSQWAEEGVLQPRKKSAMQCSC